MSEDITKYSSIDYFFFYGKNSLEEESVSDLFGLILQPKRSLYYSRSDGSGVERYENYPDALTLQIGLRFDIAQAVANRNSLVVNGRDGFRDRRIAVSQFSIKFYSNKQGDLDVTILYFLYEKFSVPQNLTLPVGNIQ